MRELGPPRGVTEQRESELPTQNLLFACRLGPSSPAPFAQCIGFGLVWAGIYNPSSALPCTSTKPPPQIYPVKLAQEAIYVDVSDSRYNNAVTRGRGGAGTSAENNNVFTVQPTVYFEGMDPTKEAASLLQVRGGQGQGRGEMEWGQGGNGIGAAGGGVRIGDGRVGKESGFGWAL